MESNGIFIKTKQAKEATNKQTATEKINLKIATAQMNKYAEKQEMQTLKELSEVLKEDEEIKYVTEKSQVADTKYEVGKNPSSIFTKLNEYPYEFEINSSLQLASIDGIKIATTQNNSFIAPNYKNLIDITQHNSNTNQYTAIDDGYIMMPTIAVINGTNIQVYIDDVLIAYVGNTLGGYIRQNIMLPIAKNSTVYWKVPTGSVSEHIPSMYFVPCK